MTRAHSSTGTNIRFRPNERASKGWQGLGRIQYLPLPWRRFRGRRPCRGVRPVRKSGIGRWFRGRLFVRARCSGAVVRPRHAGRNRAAGAATAGRDRTHLRARRGASKAGWPQSQECVKSPRDHHHEFSWGERLS